MVDLIHRTYFYGIRQMGMKDRSLIDIINPTFITLTAMAIHHRLSACKTDEFRVPPEFGPGGGVQPRCDRRNINQVVNNACTVECCHLDPDFPSSSREDQAKQIDTIRSIIQRRIHSTGTDPAMAQPHNNQGSFDGDLLDYIPEELIEQPDNSFHPLSSFVAATEASMRFSAVLPMGGSAIASSSQPVPCSNSNSNSNDITNITSIDNMGLVNGSTIAEGVMVRGGYAWCQWSDWEFLSCAILF